VASLIHLLCIHFRHPDNRKEHSHKSARIHYTHIPVASHRRSLIALRVIAAVSCNSVCFIVQTNTEYTSSRHLSLCVLLQEIKPYNLVFGAALKMPLCLSKESIDLSTHLC